MSKPAFGPMAELADTSGFIFVGSIEKPGESAMETVAGDDTTAVVRVEEAIRTPPGSGLVAGSELTVRLGSPLQRGRFIFFADLLAAGTTLALQERERLEATPDARAQVEEAITQAYAARIEPRLAAARLVVLATLGPVEALDIDLGQDDDSVPWATAGIEVEDTLLDEFGGQTPIVIGPRWPTRGLPTTPALNPGVRAIFVLQPPPPEALKLVAPEDRDRALFIADTTDIQPVERLEEIAGIARTRWEPA